MVEATVDGSKLADNVKLGSTVTIPYKVESTRAFRFDANSNSSADKAAAKVFLNKGNGDGNNTKYQPNDLSNLYSVANSYNSTPADSAAAFPDSAFTSSTTSIDSLLNQITQ
ncbi:hypothetical protein [Lentilactobacillus kosonis]|uniref:Uncharacterized protein n=1 Tax=Lentilactobacillus kosonis TaxID=2810561 RepID=A0A401FI02_9LACO|nr:hypothetical protein [Lentilactobacillus kosonis]GAY72010.1 hypothetical protein NBRC111893_156 [Lentilactobacillus kosonis]